VNSVDRLEGIGESGGREVPWREPPAEIYESPADDAQNDTDEGEPRDLAAETQRRTRFDGRHIPVERPRSVSRSVLAERFSKNPQTTAPRRPDISGSELPRRC